MQFSLQGYARRFSREQRSGRADLSGESIHLREVSSKVIGARIGVEKQVGHRRKREGVHRVDLYRTRQNLCGLVVLLACDQQGTQRCGCERPVLAERKSFAKCGFGFCGFA